MRAPAFHSAGAIAMAAAMAENPQIRHHEVIPPSGHDRHPQKKSVQIRANPCPILHEPSGKLHAARQSYRPTGNEACDETKN